MNVFNEILDVGKSGLKQTAGARETTGGGINARRGFNLGEGSLPEIAKYQLYIQEFNLEVRINSTFRSINSILDI